jgi:hypothetical protein
MSGIQVKVYSSEDEGLWTEPVHEGPSIQAATLPVDLGLGFEFDPAAADWGVSVPEGGEIQARQRVFDLGLAETLQFAPHDLPEVWWWGERPTAEPLEYTWVLATELSEMLSTEFGELIELVF